MIAYLAEVCDEQARAYGANPPPPEDPRQMKIPGSEPKALVIAEHHEHIEPELLKANISPETTRALPPPEAMHGASDGFPGTDDPLAELPS